MRDIWNPWHGCKRISEGCENCYMYYLDSLRGKDGAEIYKVKNNFDYPLHKDRNGNYKIKSGEYIRVCMTSDFFLKEADCWREEVWKIIKKRSDVIFILVTKRADRIEKCLPDDWNGGWENVWLNITCENQKRANERLPILLELPFKHKGIMAEPLIGELSIMKFLQSGQIENVWAGGENYGSKKPLFFEWVKLLSDECKATDTTFSFFETGNVFIKDGKKTVFTNKKDQAKTAFLLDINYTSSREQVFKLDLPAQYSQIGLFNQTDEEKYFKNECQYCFMKRYCAGCSNCGKC